MHEKVSIKFQILVSLGEGKESVIEEKEYEAGKWVYESAYYITHFVHLIYSTIKIFCINLETFKQNCKCFHPSTFKTWGDGIFDRGAGVGRTLFLESA